ncbi:hypothetical protein UFOVP33_27 [uncultured Caudovirales phage]|uniref:Uncharacterized protein n=1 Tax=uncultured Caudovirales phage TaxID=2100421 RepID=A0A6J5KN08_9CAUD|nr:hypothetical protein UFOVP33_27 [uncultured Caudovirales phage]
MRAVKAKALRKALGFHPAHPRDYETAKGHARMTKGPDGKPQYHSVTGTTMCGGTRGSYQKVKRAKVLTEAILRAAVLETAHG